MAFIISPSYIADILTSIVIQNVCVYARVCGCVCVCVSVCQTFVWCSRTDNRDGEHGTVGTASHDKTQQEFIDGHLKTT